MSAAILIKPHHFVDIITSFANGQRTFTPHPYGHAVHTVSARIRGDHKTLLQMELGADDICAPCCHNINGACDDTIDRSYRPDAPPLKNDWNLLLDQRWCRRLDIKSGDQFRARELCARIWEKMGDITDIYSEIPAGMTADRAVKLKKGLAVMLDGAK